MEILNRNVRNKDNKVDKYCNKWKVRWLFLLILFLNVVIKLRNCYWFDRYMELINDRLSL